MESIMWKTLLCAVLLASGTIHLPADAETFWDFKYMGFLDGTDKTFHPEYTLPGFFAGTDSNGNDLLQLSELTRFHVDGIEYTEQAGGHPGCPYNWCQVESFSYGSISGKLQFSTGWGYTDENGTGYGGAATTVGDSFFAYSYGGGNSGDLTRWQWTDQTRFEISPSPVPEPSSATFLAGLLLISVIRLRTSRSG
jgi:hypothetical protein